MTDPDRRSFLRATAGTAAVFALSPTLEFATGAPLADGEPLDVALIGAGRQGRAILAELAKFEQVRVTAVCDTIESRLRGGLRRARGAEGFADHRALLEQQKGVGAVFVATPTHLHRAVCEDALAAGKHVYCEGPLAASLDDCRLITRAARDGAGLFQTGMQARANPIYALARSFVRSGAIRDVASMRAQYHRKTSWRTPSADPANEKALNWQLDPATSLGLVGEFGVHQLDAIHWFMNAYPTSVRGTGSIQLHDDGREVFDTIACRFEFPRGRALQYEATLANSFDGMYEQFCGGMGTVKLAWNAGWLFKEADAPTQGWEVYANREQFHDEQGITLIADATKLAEQGKLKEGIGLPNPPLYYAIEAFLKSALEQAPVVCSAEEGLRAAAVVIQANEAIRTGETRTIDESLLKGE